MNIEGLYFEEEYSHLFTMGAEFAADVNTNDFLNKEVFVYEKNAIVYNPNSGMGLLKPKLSDVIDTFSEGRI